METGNLSLILIVAGTIITGIAIFFTSRTPRPGVTPFLWVLGVGLLAANLWLVLMPAGNNPSLPTNPIARTPGSVALGEALYKENCLRCHGVTFEGNGPDAATLTSMPANLTTHVPFHEDGFLFNLITNGIGAMPALGSDVPEAERWHIINYLRESIDADTEEVHGGGEEHLHEQHSDH